MSIQSQTHKFVATILQNLPEVPEDIMQGWIEKLQKFLTGLCPDGRQVGNIDLAKAYDLLGMRSGYEEAVKKFDLTEDKSLWKLVMVKELTYQKLVKAYKDAGVELELYGVDLDEVINKKEEQRNPNRDGSYLVSFTRNVEADEENKNKSADQRKEHGCQDITLMERLLLGLAYFLATGQHLDVKNYTLCSGSRSSGGDAPDVRWSPVRRRVFVDWCNPADDLDDDIRARSVVFLFLSLKSR